MSHPQRKFLIPLVVFALAGVLFAAVSTHDFIKHLDRQLHPVACSFVPTAANDSTRTSGCYTVLMSPYSSVMRSSVWGGIPIALPGLGVFAFLTFLGLDILLRKADNDPHETRFMLLATLVPLVTSCTYWYIAVKVVGAVCKLCVGIYIASFASFILALITHLSARRHADPEAAKKGPWKRYALWFVEGIGFVGVPLLVFLASHPAYTAEMGRCGELIHPEDKYNVQLKLYPSAGGTPALEIIDPLCPACKVFKQRLGQSGRMGQLDVKAVLFPLDSTCNWMVTDSLHPGACAVSEAALCAGDQAAKVIDWSLAHNEELRTLAKDQPQAIYDRIKQQFPELAGCVGKPEVKARLNKSLRWIASNSLPVVTPQLYVRGRKLCEEDSDLGLEFALDRLLKQEAAPAGGAR
jgi:uncharacterized membrane protein